MVLPNPKRRASRLGIIVGGNEWWRSKELLATLVLLILVEILYHRRSISSAPATPSGGSAAMAAMSAIGQTVQPRTASRQYHERKYAVFRRMYDDQLAYRAIMQQRDTGAA